MLRRILDPQVVRIARVQNVLVRNRDSVSAPPPSASKARVGLGLREAGLLVHRDEGVQPQA